MKNNDIRFQSESINNDIRFKIVDPISTIYHIRMIVCAQTQMHYSLTLILRRHTSVTQSDRMQDQRLNPLSEARGYKTATSRLRANFIAKLSYIFRPDPRIKPETYGVAVALKCNPLYHCDIGGQR